MIKRYSDVFFAVFWLLVLSPLMLVIAVAIKGTSPGPVIFKQKRVGFNREVFTIWKFRTMYKNSGKGLDLVVKNDRRVTRVGRLLRSLHADELPQLYNIIRGEMSFVGPRPYTIEIDREFVDAFHKRRYNVRPGLTCFSQLLKRPETLDKESRKALLQSDADYVLRTSLLLDLQILFQTIFVVLKRNGV